MVPSERVPTSSLPRLRRGPPLPVRSGAHASRSLPLSAAIALHEIHLAPQSSLQVPVGHIPVPGGIKLCSPGTFWVANYLIINNGPCQVNFTKTNTATIRCTNSQWLREDATEALVGKVAVKNPVVNPTLIPSTVPISFPSARDPACGQGRRAKDRSEERFATQGCP